MLQEKQLVNCKALLIQYCPIPRDIESNMKKIESLLSKYTDNNKIDIVVFPEMTLTGYIFDNIEDIKPYLEEYNKGKTFEFCSKIAKKLLYLTLDLILMYLWDFLK